MALNSNCAAHAFGVVLPVVSKTLSSRLPIDRFTMETMNEETRGLLTLRSWPFPVHLFSTASTAGPSGCAKTISTGL